MFVLCVRLNVISLQLIRYFVIVISLIIYLQVIPGLAAHLKHNCHQLERARLRTTHTPKIDLIEIDFAELSWSEEDKRYAYVRPEGMPDKSTYVVDVPYVHTLTHHYHLVRVG